MNIKCIAIGNRIMGDDGIGIKVAEELLSRLHNDNIEMVFGETDSYYALRCIENGDLVFILDSTYFNMDPGTVTYIPINDSPMKIQGLYSPHQDSLISLLRLYKKSIEGFIIGIEAGEIGFGLQLSNQLKIKLPHICEEVYGFIHNITGGINNA